MIGAILAGGGSRRFGGTPKADLALPDGRPMIAAVAEAMRPLVEEIVILGDATDWPWTRKLTDRRPGQGPLAGLETLLDGLDDAASALVCPCDMPRLTTPLLARLAARVAAPLSVFRVEGTLRALPLRIHASAGPDVSRALDAGRRSVRGLFEVLDVHAIAVETDERPQLDNVNTPEDLARLVT